ncbi:MAG: DUF2877 domain-containing protein [Magnetovibrionaceae bacterium]
MAANDPMVGSTPRSPVVTSEDADGKGSRWTLEIAQSGRLAERVFRPGMRGEIVGITRDRLLIEDGDGHIAVVAGPAFPKAPLTARLSADLPHRSWYWFRLQAGERVYEAGGALRVGEELAIRFSHAEHWRGPQLQVPLRPGWDAMAEAVLALAPDHSICRLLRPWLDGVDVVADGALRDALTALAGWLKAPRGFPPDAVSALIGSGEGLSPAGDDLIAGVLLGLNAHDRRSDAERLAAFALPLAADRSGPLSPDLMAAALEGESFDNLHEVMTVLALPGAPDLTAALAGLAVPDGTSPWDTFGGVLLVLAATG